jgi:SAM-dependent methyltransferase
MSKSIIKEVESYYTNKILENGVGSQGVDWNGKESQYLRFEQLSKILPIQNNATFSIIDFGCGYGEFINYLHQYAYNFEFYGLDISEKMLEIANKNFQEDKFTFAQSLADVGSKDYLTASGVFNVRQNTTEHDWLQYIIETLNCFNAYTTKGFSFNLLTSYSDKPFMKDYLYYADPIYFFDYCKKHFSRNIALLHDYELYEFTILVRK